MNRYIKTKSKLDLYDIFGKANGDNTQNGELVYIEPSEILSTYIDRAGYEGCGDILTPEIVELCQILEEEFGKEFYVHYWW